MNWQNELKKSIYSERELIKYIDLTAEEKKWFQSLEKEKLPFLAPPLLLKKITKKTLEENNPLRLQIVPQMAELTTLKYESKDPLVESQYSPIPGIIHRYKSRILIYGGTHCALFCRHCFRRHLSGSKKQSIYSNLPQLTQWLKKHPEVKEVLISGGDPLIEADVKIKKLLEAIRNADIKNNRRVIRICTRTPISLPSRFTKKLLKILKEQHPIWIVTQINHPDEITAEAKSTFNKILLCGIPILNQTVLLKGVNDKVETLQTLMENLVSNRIKPYYLFQGDLAAGTSHLRVPLTTGLKLQKELRRRVSGLAMPTYAVDLPNGGGKVPLTESYLINEDNNFFYFRSIEGKEHKYPKE